MPIVIRLEFTTQASSTLSAPCIVQGHREVQFFARNSPIRSLYTEPQFLESLADIERLLRDGRTAIRLILEETSDVGTTLQYVRSVSPLLYDQLMQSTESLTTALPDGKKGPTEMADQRKIFVVHGRNTMARDAMFTFLRSIKLDPIEWSEAIKITGKPSPYIGDILDTAFGHAQAIVVLMTPDDIACLRKNFVLDSDPPHERALTPQARANVLFEAGMAMGRYPDRTILVEVGTVRPFSDIGGRHVVRLDNQPARRQDLADRLELANCKVDLSGRDWHTAGDFDKSIELTPPEVPQRDDDTSMLSTFSYLQGLMPDLLAEMATDLRGDKTHVVREFVVLPSRRVIFNSAKPRFAYYEEEHEGLRNKIDLLEEHGFVVDVTPEQTPVYRMTDEFEKLLLKD